MKFRPAVFVALAFLGFFSLSPHAAYADAASVQLSKAMDDIAKENRLFQKEQMKVLTSSFSDNFNDLKNNQNEIERDHEEEERKSAAMPELEPAMDALPSAIAKTDISIRDIMSNRYKELNRIPVSANKAQYLVDTTLTAEVDTQAFDIFMRYFCDPDARAGKMGKLEFNQQGTDNAAYKLQCGSSTKGESRHSINGTDDTTDESKLIIGLPIRTGDLYFEPTTFPTITDSAHPDASNTSKLAEVYYGAFAQSLQFLVGTAPPNGASIAGQAEISRQMLASYPFAILFAERAGGMGENAAKSLAALLRSKLGSATEDAVIDDHLRSITKRQSVSIAEYNDIIMYQLMMSPDYYRRISTLNFAQLRREEVWLTSLQTALNYQRNRWLEILASLEAVRK